MRLRLMSAGFATPACKTPTHTRVSDPMALFFSLSLPLSLPESPCPFPRAPSSDHHSFDPPGPSLLPPLIVMNNLLTHTNACSLNSLMHVPLTHSNACSLYVREKQPLHSLQLHDLLMSSPASFTSRMPRSPTAATARKVPDRQAQMKL